MKQNEKAARLLELHHGEKPLVLVNAWDAASACIMQQSGLPAVATTSAGVANALGRADGQNVPWTEMLEAIRRIAQAVHVPVTADIEAGFSKDAHQLEWALEQLIEAGVAGLNLEDAIPGQAHGPLYPVAEQVERITAVRRIAEKLKVRLVINARTDAFWQKGVQPDRALAATLERGHAYLKAGADCIFVPGMHKPEHIRNVVGEWKSPVNILAGLGVPSVNELAQLGVKRISFGSGPMRAAMGVLRRIVDEAKVSGTYKAMTDVSVSYDEMNALFSS